MKRYAVKYMESKGSFEYCLKVLKTLGERARKMVVELDGVSGSCGGWEQGGKGDGLLKILEKMVV